MAFGPGAIVRALMACPAAATALAWAGAAARAWSLLEAAVTAEEAQKVSIPIPVGRLQKTLGLCPRCWGGHLQSKALARLACVLEQE